MGENVREVFDLFAKLQETLMKTQRRDAIKNIAQYVSCSQALNDNLPYDETTLVAKISNHLSASKSQTDCTQFLNSYERLSTCMESKQRIAILTFLLYMINSNVNGLEKTGSILRLSSMAAPAPATAASFDQSIGRQFFNSNNLRFERIYSGGSDATGVGGAGVGAAGASTSCSINTLYSNNSKNSKTTKNATNTAQSTNASTIQLNRLYPGADKKPIITASPTASSENFLKLTAIKPYGSNAVGAASAATPQSTTSSHTNINHQDRLATELNEDLVQDVIYALTGIQGKYLRRDYLTGGFKLDPKARALTVANAGMLMRLAELGYYHDRVQSLTDSNGGRLPYGLLGQGLVTQLKHELTQYYGMVAVLQEQLNRQRSIESWQTVIQPNNGEQISLMKIMLWSAEPLHRLKWLTTISAAAQDRKGGGLVTAIAEFQHNGDPCVKQLVHELLLAACIPLVHMLSKWLCDGEIDDPYSEFFIEIIPDISVDRLWNGKYRVRDIMLPNFISKELANKILVTGKSINFLREVCQDKIPIKCKEELKQCLKTNGHELFSMVPDTKLHSLIDTVYLNTSKRVLDIALGQHKLLQHLQAMRNYLLLGQGDLIGILMEHLKPELDRPAKELYSYELSSILDAAIRSTNAQYDDPEILNQLDVKLLGNFDGDRGWDIFTLNYTVQGPLSTLLEPDMGRYQSLFKPLWKMKHLEFVLSAKIWKNQIINAKALRPLQKTIHLITYRLHLYTSEMIHFIHQMQYYILFEVIECLWTQMLDRINKAKTLDDILMAHSDFLRDTKIGLFLEDGNTLFATLESVLAATVRLEVWQEKFYSLCFIELDAHKVYEKSIRESASKGTYGITAEAVLERDEQKQQFRDELIQHNTTLDKIGCDFECAVRQFLLMLASHNDHNLQLFGTRLDFNEFYKKRDHRLDAPLMFANMRQSSMLFSNNRTNNSRNSNRFGLN